MLGITVVPVLINGQPHARVTIVGTTADSVTMVDPNGAEIAINVSGSQFHVVDYRGADAVSG